MFELVSDKFNVLENFQETNDCILRTQNLKFLQLLET